MIRNLAKSYNDGERLRQFITKIHAHLVFRARISSLSLAGLEMQTQNAAFFERKRPKRKPWHRGESLNRQKMIAMRFLNASV